MEYLDLARRLAALNKKMLKIPAYVKMTESNRGEGVLLSYLARHCGKATPAELSGDLQVSSARIAALLNKMERKHLVKREKHLQNSRNVMVRLLPAGQERYEQQREEFFEKTMDFFHRLGEERAVLFVELQEELMNFLKKDRERGDIDGASD